MPFSCLSTAPLASVASMPACVQRSSRCHRSRQDVRSKLAGPRSPHIASPALSTGGSVRARRLAHLAWPALLPRSSSQACPLARGARPNCRCRCRADHSKRARWLRTHLARPALLPGDFLQSPARARRSSHCQHCCQEAPSERASSLMIHFAWPTQLPRNSFQGCPLVLAPPPPPLRALLPRGSARARQLVND